MDRIAADRKIDSILNAINADNVEKLLAELDELFLVKPVSSMWNIARAKALTILGRVDEAYAVLGENCSIYDASNYLTSLYNQYELLAKSYGDERNRVRNKYIKEVVSVYLGDMSANDIEAFNEEKKLAHSLINKNDISEDSIKKEKECLYKTQDLLMLSIIEAYCIRNNISVGIDEWVKSQFNTGFIREYLLSNEAKNIVIVETENEIGGTSNVIAKLCKEMGHKVFFLCKAKQVEDETSIEDLLEYSLNGITVDENLICIPTFYNNECGDNTDYVLKHFYENEFENEMALCFSSGTMIDALSVQPTIQKHIQRLTMNNGEFLEDNTCCAWFGSYLSYISCLYGFDAEKKISSASTCRFSIVLPARNSAYTLRETIKTCLNQTYSGTYEIVLSDNSTDGNTEVYELYKSINDTRVKYFKTPRNLHLPKSFEYAYLCAQGEYILAIGSDDALLPWCLDTLDNVIKKHKEDNIIQWERGLYCWPGFNGSQQNQFVIPKEYSSNDKVFYKSSGDYWAEVLLDENNMYNLPMLYINSCFKRTYFYSLLNNTGRLWDGTCQDIYIGLVNISINSRILNIEYPLSIAGMSDNSIGTRANRTKATLSESLKVNKGILLEGNAGGYSISVYEKMIPFTGTDTWSFYTSILRLVTIGVIPLDYIEKLVDWKKVFIKLIAEVGIDDTSYDKRLRDMRFSASLHGSEFYEWFEKELKPVALNRQRNRVDGLKAQKKSYETGLNKQGGIVLDASVYGVSNSYEASLLFERLMCEGYKSAFK